MGVHVVADVLDRVVKEAGLSPVHRVATVFEDSEFIAANPAGLDHEVGLLGIQGNRYVGAFVAEILHDVGLGNIGSRR